MKKKVYLIDGNNFSDLECFYEEIGNKLVPNTNWGKNLDAFNDILFGGFGEIDCGEPFDLIWKNSSKSKIDLGYSETIRQLNKRLKSCHPSNIATVRGYIKEAENNEGTTVYEWLIEIIRDNDNVALFLE